MRRQCSLILGVLALIPSAAMAGSSTIGRTWPIAETDALTEIESKAASTPADPARFGPRSGWSGLKAASLSPATVSRTRFVVPFYTLDGDIRLPDGRLLYAKGYTFNPLAYTSLPQRLIVVCPRDLDWAMGQAQPGDDILLTAGSPGDTDAITLGTKHHRPIFILEDRIKSRLGLTVAPVIIRQTGQRLELREVHVETRRTGA
ncbi:conjugal transfer protein TraW [Novosphingobium rosa]|uniref:conjugal transfer protein TraW n=1 Tax=Novosphingobium rosa TaxID=76978 RepID=UPI0008297323|nr:conjugal transfer protein TraW [Novosphingobium rosa]